MGEPLELDALIVLQERLEETLWLARTARWEMSRRRAEGAQCPKTLKTSRSTVCCQLRAGHEGEHRGEVSW